MGQQPHPFWTSVSITLTLQVRLSGNKTRSVRPCFHRQPSAPHLAFLTNETFPTEAFAYFAPAMKDCPGAIRGIGSERCPE